MSYKCFNKGKNEYFKKDSLKALNNFTKIIFDFDGVLVQTLQSYRQAIISVVDYYFLEILGLGGETRKLVTLKDVQKFKDTGMFNNDWNLSQAIIAYYLATLIEKLSQKNALEDFRKLCGDIHFSELRSFLKTLEKVGDFIKHYGLNAVDLIEMKNDIKLGIESFIAQTRLKNQNSIEATLASFFPLRRDDLLLIQNLVPYDTEKPDLLKRLFEELYLGMELFEKFSHVSSYFKFTDSFLETETFIPTREILEMLHLKHGEFLIYSEKSRIQGMYILEKNDFTKYFNEKMSIFIEDLVGPEANSKVKLGKPNPTKLLEMIKESVEKNIGVAYVGDGVADALLVQNARQEGLSRLLFIGVLSSTQNPNKLLSLYMRYGADAILTDVNGIPNLLTSLGGN